MSTTQIYQMSAESLAQAIRAKLLSPVEVTQAFITRIEQYDAEVNAFCLKMFDTALDKAKRAEKAQMKGEFWGALHGVPYAMKDSDDYQGLPTLCGSEANRNHIATVHAPIIERMEKAGAIPLGRTTTPELAWMGLTHSKLNGITHNPWHTEKNAGGSSGGSAVAIATKMAPLAIGTDGAGSIRIPASFCGIYGLKPSHGRIPLNLPNTNQHTHYGPMTANVRDAALMMDVCSGSWHQDLYSLEGSHHYLANIEKPMKGLKFAWSADFGFVQQLDPEVKTICEKAAQQFELLGAEVVEAKIDLTGIDEIAKRNWQAIMSAIVLHAKRPYLDDFDPALVACAKEAATQTSGAFLYDKVRMYPIYQRLVAYFEQFDFILSPSVACPAITNGLLRPESYGTHAWDWMEWAPYSSPFNLFHNPAASVPAGLTQQGLPVGLQIVGPRHADLAVLQASYAFEQLGFNTKPCPDKYA